MTLELERDARQPMIDSLKRYFDEEMEQPIGDLKASLILDFFLEEIGPTIYNRAIHEAQTWMAARVADLDGSCWEEEHTYWRK